MLSPAEVSQLRTGAGLSPTPPQAGATDVISQRQAALGLNQPSATSQPGLLSRIGSDLANRGKAIGQDFSQSFSQGKNPVQATLQAAQGGLRIAGDIGGGIADTAGELINPVMSKVLSIVGAGSQSNNPVSNAVDSATQKATDAYASWEQAHPDAAKNLKSVFDIAQGGLTVAGGVEGVSKLADAAPGAFKDISQVPGEIASKVKSMVPGSTPPTPEDLLKGATKQITPDYEAASATQKASMQNQTVTDASGNSQPRITEGKGIGGSPVKGQRIVNLTNSEKATAQTLSEVPGYNPNATNLETHNLIKNEIGTTAQKLSDSLQNENQVIPKKEIISTVRNAVNDTSKESLLLQKSDPAIKNYMRVVTNATNQADGTLKGVLDVRKAMDVAYENARGKLAFGSDKMSALDEVHTASRNALNDYAISHAQSTDVKALLQKQANLYRADDVINAKASTEGTSSIGRLENKIDKSPVSRIVKKLPIPSILKP